MALYTLFDIISDNLFTESEHNANFAQYTEGVFAPDAFCQDSDTLPPRDERDQTPNDPPLYAFLRITSSSEHRPKQPGRGWILGRSPDCDFVIGSKQDGVSRYQFEVIPQEEPGLLAVKNLSQNGTYMKMFGEKVYTRVQSQRGLGYAAGEVQILVNRVTMDLSAARVSGEGFKKAWAELGAVLWDNGPALSSLTVAAPASSTYVSRHILCGAFDSHSEYRIFVAEQRDTRRKVLLKRYSGRDAATKSAREVEVHSKLKHVSSLA